MHLATVLILIASPMMALSALPEGTNQTMFGCTVTIYKGVFYNRDEILGKYKGYPMDTMEACIERCMVVHQDCVAVNLVNGKSCQPLRTGVENETSDYFLAKVSDHAVISCTEPEDLKESVGCGKQAANYQPAFPRKTVRIIGGNEAKPHSWPWQVLLKIPIGSCGATLIRVKEDKEKSDILVTAAHCVTTGTLDQVFNASTVSVVAGNHNLDKVEAGEQGRMGDQIKIHPDYQVSGSHHDIALIKLAKPIKFTDTIRPVCLPAQGEELPVGKKCAAAGWGRISSSTSDKSKTLKQLLVDVRTVAECRRNSAGGWGSTYIEKEMICAGSMKADEGICRGDSGGMLACEQEDKSWTLYGASSFVAAPGCLEPGTPGIFTRISSYVDWITENAASMTSV